jgi:ketosteroid isomerase-like protein
MISTLTLPPILTTMVAALNAQDGAAFIACFADDAVVRDEGKVLYGKAAIQSWFVDVNRKYQATFHVTDLTFVDGEPVLTGNVSGTFDGSPIQLRYYTALDDGKIIALKIAP